MKSEEFLKQLKEHALVVVVRGKSVEEAKKTVDACYAGGVRLVEITFTVPNAEVLIAEVKKAYEGKNLIVGAGTVLDIETAKIAIEVGAEFIVSPMLSEDIIRYCNNLGVACTPGILTPTELLSALRAGAGVLKLFPGDIAKPAGLKALKGPFPNINIMPTGGVSYDNLNDWFSAGAVAVGAGSNLTAGAKKGDFAAVTEDCKKWIIKINEIRGNNK